MIQTIALSNEAGISKAVKTGVSPMEINDGEYNGKKTALVGDPIGASVRRTKNKVSAIAGILRPKLEKSKSVAYRY